MYTYRFTTNRFSNIKSGFLFPYERFHRFRATSMVQNIRKVEKAVVASANGLAHFSGSLTRIQKNNREGKIFFWFGNRRVSICP